MGDFNGDGDEDLAVDSAGASIFVKQIEAGITFGFVAAEILGSEEFFVAAGQNL